MQLTVYKEDKIVTEIDLELIDLHPKEGVVEFYIGRSEECHLELDDKKVSRIHAVLKLSEKGWSLKNLSEGLGTFVNGRNLQSERDIKSGDVINLGPFAINTFYRPIEKESLKKDLGLPIDEVLIKEDDTKTDENVAEKDLAAKEDLGNHEEESPESFNDLSIPEEGSDENLAEGSNEVENEYENDGGDMFGGVVAEGAEEGAIPDSDESEAQGLDYGSDEDSLPAVDSETKIISTFVKYYLKIFGEFAPYDNFSLDENEIFIGRDSKKCQIVLKDPDVSTSHAVIRKENFKLTIEDLGSTNGTVLNGQRINKADLVHGDEFVIGSTTFKFETASDLIKNEEDRLMPVEMDQEIEIEEVVEEEVDFSDLNEGEMAALPRGESASKSSSLFSKDSLKDPAKRKKIMYIVIGLLLLWVLLGEEEPEVAKESGKKEEKSVKKKEEVTSSPSASRKPQRVLTKEEQQYVEVAYNLSKELFAQGRYEEAQREIDKVLSVSGIKFKEAEQLKNAIAQGYKRIKEEEEKRQRELDEKKKKLEIEKLLELAKDAVEEKKIELAEGLFAKIMILDPEQPEVGFLKMEIEAYKREEEKKRMEEERKKAERESKVEKLRPGKELYLQKKWFLAINELKRFIQVKNMDEDLTKEGTKMLEDSESNLNDEISPLLGEARSLKEGQDLKGAYEGYKKVLVLWPNHSEALKEVSGIKEELDSRSSKLYREAIISESLSLYKEAEEKFQEVLQVAPIDSDYYMKSKDKLKDIVR